MNHKSIVKSSLQSECWPIDGSVKSAANKAICITGSGRSGTTLLGSIVHSLQSVEYGFEPPVLVSLFLRESQVPEFVWNRLYAEYLYEEILLGALTARNLNFNEDDWSCIFRAKPREEVLSRWRPSNRRRDLRAEAETRTVAYKIPNITHALSKMRAAYPSSRVIVVLRHPDPVARSVMARGWFHGDPMNYHICGALRIVNGVNAPACLAGLEPEDWMLLNEEQRCHAVYTGCYNNVDPSTSIIVEYDKLLRNPHDQVERLAHALQLQWGGLTSELVARIQDPASHISSQPNRDSEWRGRAVAAYERLLHSAI